LLDFEREYPRHLPNSMSKRTRLKPYGLPFISFREDWTLVALTKSATFKLRGSFILQKSEAAVLLEKMRTKMPATVYANGQLSDLLSVFEVRYVYPPVFKLRAWAVGLVPLWAAAVIISPSKFVASNLIAP
jgi:hypothetical protein